jgi:hypothetical protein
MSMAPADPLSQTLTPAGALTVAGWQTTRKADTYPTHKRLCANV